MCFWLFGSFSVAYIASVWLLCYNVVEWEGTMKRQELLLKYAETSVEIYRKLHNTLLSNSPIVTFERGNAVLTFPADCERNELPLNGIYVMLDRDPDTGELGRVVRIGTHEPTNPNGLLSRVFSHMSGSKNRSILRKHVGSSLLKGKPKSLETWRVKTVPGDPSVERKVTEYLLQHVAVAFLRVDKLDALADIEKYLISAVAVATVTDSELIAARADWLGNNCDDPTVAEYGIWNDDHVKWHPRDESELKKLVRTLDKYI